MPQQGLNASLSQFSALRLPPNGNIAKNASKIQFLENGCRYFSKIIGDSFTRVYVLILSMLRFFPEKNHFRSPSLPISPSPPHKVRPLSGVEVGVPPASHSPTSAKLPSGGRAVRSSPASPSPSLPPSQSAGRPLPSLTRGAVDLEGFQNLDFYRSHLQSHKQVTSQKTGSGNRKIEMMCWRAQAKKAKRKFRKSWRNSTRSRRKKIRRKKMVAGSS